MPSPISSYASAIAAYARAATASSAAAVPTGTEPAGGGGFATMLKGVLEHAAESGKASEQAAAQAITSRGDLTQVVTSVAEAEVMLQSVVAIRDRAIEAYKDIMHMPI